MQTIYAGGGAQDVEVYALDALGRVALPSSATAKIVDLCEPDTAPDADRIVEDTAPAVIDATATTTTSAAGPKEADKRRVSVVNSAGFVVGRKYGLQGGGSTEAFDVERVDGLDIYTRDALRTRFASGAAVVGLRVSATFPAARADDADELGRRADFGCDWTFAGVTGPPVVRTLARIERRGRALRATAADLLQIDPQFAEVTHSRTTLESHLRQADLEVDALLLHRGSPLADTLEGTIGKLAVGYTALALAYRVLGDNHVDRALWAEGLARRWVKMLIGGAKPDDAVETTRTTDQSRRGRRRFGLSVPGGA
jgi:hypothetical protein